MQRVLARSSSTVIRILQFPFPSILALMSHPVIRAQADLSSRLVNDNTWYANAQHHTRLVSRWSSRLSPRCRSTHETSGCPEEPVVSVESQTVKVWNDEMTEVKMTTSRNAHCGSDRATRRIGPGIDRGLHLEGLGCLRTMFTKEVWQSQSIGCCEPQ